MPFKDPEKQKASQKRYVSRNKQKIYEYRKKWIHKNKDRINKRRRERRAQNPERYAGARKKEAVYRRNRHREINKRLVELFGGKCIHCGIVSDPCIYDFHHRDPSQKEFVISIMTSKSMNNVDNWNKLIAECNKCDLVCSNCHRLVHRGLIFSIILY